MADRLRAARVWLALRLARLASWLAPAGVGVVPAQASDVLPARAQCAPAAHATLFKVERRIAGNSWTLLDSTPDGAAARRIFERVRDNGELGSMTLEMNAGDGWIVRGHYESKE